MAIRNLCEGEFDCCAHRISFWFDIGERELTDEMTSRLEDSAFERAKESICEGFVSGELCELYTFENDEQEELRGWWDILPSL